MWQLIAAAMLTSTEAAAADARAFSDELTSIPMLAWGLATMIALVGGFTRIISQLAHVPPTIELAPGPILRALWMSLMGGSIGFFVALGLDTSPPYVAVLVFAGAVAGSAAVDAVREWLPSVLTRGPK